MAHGPPGGAFGKLPLQAGKPTSLGEKALLLQFPKPAHADVAFCCMALRLSYWHLVKYLVIFLSVKKKILWAIWVLLVEMTSGGATVCARLWVSSLGSHQGWEEVLTRVSWMVGDGFTPVLPHSRCFSVLLSPPVVSLGCYYPISNNTAWSSRETRVWFSAPSWQLTNIHDASRCPF